MRLAYLDCFAGISGDMFLAVLLDSGVPAQVMHDAVAALNLNASLRTEKVDRSGISATKVHVLEGDDLAETKLHSKAQSHSHSHSHTHEAHSETQAHTHSHSETHSHSHREEQSHKHVHGRSLSVIRDLIQSSALADAVKQTAIRAFELLGEAEAKIHSVPIEQIHFHEVGAVDAIVDIVCASAGIVWLSESGPVTWHCSPINVGGGMVECAHGTFPVPAPATADLLRGFPTYSAHIQKELVTPTGAALLRALAPSFGPQPAMRANQIGYGAGTRNPKGFPNVLRLTLGESTETQPAQSTVTVLETALDDLNPQILAAVAERALELGALDVMLTPVIMKKGRPGTLLTLLCNPDQTTIFEQLLFRETSTLGLRFHTQSRSILDRQHTAVATEFGEIRIKTGSRQGQVLNANPEFEDCRAAAFRHGVPVKQVIQAAIAAYQAEAHE